MFMIVSFMVLLRSRNSVEVRSCANSSRFLLGFFGGSGTIGQIRKLIHSRIKLEPSGLFGLGTKDNAVNSGSSDVIFFLPAKPFEIVKNLKVFVFLISDKIEVIAIS